MRKTKRASDGSDEHTSKKKELPLYGNKNPNECKFSRDLGGVVICTGNFVPCVRVRDSECETTPERKERLERFNDLVKGHAEKE